MTFTKKEKEPNYYRSPNLWGLRPTALTSKTVFQAQRQLWSPPKNPTVLPQQQTIRSCVWGIQHSAMNLLQAILPILQTLRSERCKSGAPVYAIAEYGRYILSLKTCPALLSQSIHFAFSTSFTLIILSETNLWATLKSPTKGPH